jgi:SH3-like domain-containing protein
MSLARLITTLLVCLAVSQARAGEEIMAEFSDTAPSGGQRTPEVLAHVPLKAVIAEFLDPMDTGLGKSLGYLIWRETLTAISDQAGAGVIMAKAPPGERLVELLKNDYHLAAERIARNQRSRMVLWGVVESEGDSFLIEPYLSIRDEGGDSALRLTLSAKSRAGRSEWGDGAGDESLGATVSRTRFNFAPSTIERTELFRRPLITQSAVDIRQHPRADATVIQRVPGDQVLQAVDMRDDWFEVALDGGERGYVHAGSFGRLRLPPREVVAQLRGVNLRKGPGTDHAVVRNDDLVGTFPVLDMRYRHGKGLWYRIDAGAEESWIAGWLVRPRFSIPAVHFLAGLYRYYGDRAKDGVAAFEDFIASTGPHENNVVLASAHQLLGVCRLLSNEPAGKGHEAFSRAIHHTPYDPDAYLLRSVAAFGGGRTDAALDDLEKALSLDMEYPPARQLTLAAAALAQAPHVTPLSILTGLMGESRRTNQLLGHYGIAPE